MILKALPHTDDLDDLKKVAQFHSKTQVLRTLDKLAIRKEFHEALEKYGLDIQSIVRELKEICMNSEREDTRLRGLQTVLRAVGLEKYEVAESVKNDWEELLLKIGESENKQLEPGTKAKDIIYEVTEPAIPDSAKQQLQKDRTVGGSIYE